MNDAVDPALVAARFATYGLAIFGFGAASFPVFVGGAPAGRWARGLAAGLAAAALAYLALLAREVGGPATPVLALPGMMLQLVAGAGFGQALTAITVLALILVAVPARWRRVRLALAGAGLAALAFVGHAADGTGPRGLLRLAMMALHLLAIGTWIGALPSLLLALRPGGAAPAPTLRRFGQVAGLALAVVLGTGLVSLAFVVADVRGAVGMGYLRVLGVKLGFVAGLVTLAVINRFALTPRIAGPGRALAALRWSIAAEQALGLGAIAAVAVLGQMDPTM